MIEIVHKELSYKIMGILFAVHNQLGPGYAEKHYQRGIKDRFISNNISFQEQLKVNINEKCPKGCFYIDFVVDNKVVLEIKAKPKFSKDNILQVLRYLRATGLELGILANFSRRELIYKRLLRGIKCQLR